MRECAYSRDVSSQRSITERELLENLGWIRGLARRLVGEGGDDLTQQVCVAALDRSRITPGPPTTAAPRVRGWLARATIYLANHHRSGEKRRRDRESRCARIDAQPSAFDVVERNATLVRVVQAVHGLAEPYRTTVLHRYLDELSTRQIADRSRVAESVVRKRLSRGLAMLREDLQEHDVDRWALCALIGFAPLRGAAATVSSSASSTLGVMTMGMTITKMAAVGVVVAGGASFAIFSGSDPDLEVLDRPGVEDSRVDEVPLARRVAITEEPESEQTPLGDESDPAPPRKPVTTEKDSGQPSNKSKISADELRYKTQRMAAMAIELDMLAALEASMRSQDRPPDGHRVEKYDDGDRKAAGMIVNGYRDGIWTEWHENGNKKSRGSYFAGKKQGPWVQWDEEGVEVQRGEFVYGRHEGPWVRVKDGIRTECEYRNHKKHGPARQIRADGNPAAEQSWFLGNLHGLSSRYHQNGQLAAQGKYVHGVKVDGWEYWRPDGTLDDERSGLVGEKGPQSGLEKKRAQLKARLEAMRKRAGGR